MGGCYQYVMEGNKLVCDFSWSWNNPNTGGVAIAAIIVVIVAIIYFWLSSR